MLKKKTGYVIGILAGLFTCGCGRLSTNSQDVVQIIHKESTLSTEQSTNVDNTVDDAVDLLITYEETTENRTEFETRIEETTESDTETLSEEEEELQEVFSDAAYYYGFYASIFYSRDESTSLTFDRETFENAYENVKEETLENYFESCQWISREGGISLSLTPKTSLFPEGNADVYSWEARCIHAFALLRAAYETDEHWDNGDSMEPQFHCHAIYARQNKVPWNIEPYRTETSFLRILLTGGNPES